MSASDSDEYHTRFALYEKILKEAKKAIQEDISEYEAGTDDMKEYISSHINVLFKDHVDDFQDRGISRRKVDDLEERMNAELCPKPPAKKKRTAKTKPPVKKKRTAKTKPPAKKKRTRKTKASAKKKRSRKKPHKAKKRTKRRSRKKRQSR